MNTVIPMTLNFATNPESALNVGEAVEELAISGINVGKAVKDLKSMANAKKAASEIKNNIISIGKGFRVI